MPAITVLIPARNAEATLAETLESLVAQTWRDFDVLLVDDASTARLMRSFYSRLGAGARPAAALRAAQLEQAQAGAHPFHWAAFALHGQA